VGWADGHEAIMSDQLQPFKIAFRSEGTFVVAYFSSLRMYDGSMEPIEVARIRKSVLTKTEGLFEDFQAVVRKAISQMCVDKGLPRPDWKTQRAPEDEKTGQA
jgi:hypothetical protein